MHLLPTIDAILNGIATVCLLMGYSFIRSRKERAHRTAMLCAFVVSIAFLTVYVVHHVRVGSVPFQGQGWLRIVYFTILIPHIVLAVLVPPLALLTIYRGWTDQRARHRRIAKVTLPIWLFVSVSGIVVYLMLYHLPV